ncbi:MAG: hypothetical protein E7629_01735 [Ruminococcaceae bacterium]|nr:hypothetical protein [Oscillospiraceae bacterium]
MLNLICGPSGSGKTARLLQDISADIQAQRKCFLLVPEQQAYISERDFPSVLPQNAGRYFQIVHFSGLAEDVFRQYGGVTQSNINGGLRALLMWDTLRTVSPLLKCYGHNAQNDNTLTELLLQTLSELHANGINGELLEDTANKLSANSPLQNKLMDLALIDSVFRQKLKDCFGSDPEDKLVRLTEKLREHDYFQNAQVYIDSFTSFTEQEYGVLREILRQADRVTVSLCADSFTSRLPHFETVIQTYKRLQKLASEADVDLQKKQLFMESAEKNAVFSRIERDLWRFDAPVQKCEGNNEETSPVTLLRCNNLYEESEAAALNILDLVQTGMRYGEIAVVVRDTETYRGVLDAAMERHGIPYFISERTDFSSKPLFRLILSALKAVCRYYPLQEILTLVKTGLAGVSVRDVSLFEEYCETWRISGSRFLDEVWSMNPDGLTTERSPRAEEILKSANDVRKAVIDPMKHLAAELKASPRLQDKCAALYHYLINLEISEKLCEQAKSEMKAGRRREAGEALRLYSQLCETLTTLCKLLPNTEMTTEEFAAALNLLFAGTDMGSVPNLHDCVMIGSASTMRVEKIRAALLLGLCEGEFPKAISDDGILSEHEKEALEPLGLVLQSREKTRVSEELLYVYRAITKPSERLFLSTVASEPDGSARTPSLAFNRVALLLDQAPQKFDLTEIKSLRQLQENTTAENDLRLPPMPSGTTLRLSQSKIKSFVLCPYSYYSTYSLKLREEKSSTPRYADDGTFLHYVFEKFLSSALQEDGTLALPPEEEVEPIADEIITAYLEEVCPLGLDRLSGRLLHLYTRLRKLALLMLSDMIAELHFCQFIPSRFEQVIGSSEANGIPTVKLELKDGSRVILSGMIDRVDLYKTDDKIYVRVVDYKSGEHKFALKDVSTGLDIQLILYLFAMLSSNPHKYVAGGAEYLYTTTEKGKTGVFRSGLVLADGEIAEALDASADKRFSKKLIQQTKEEIDGLIQEMKLAVTEIAERILAGEAQKTPSKDACRFCPVINHCDKAFHE